MQTVAQARRVNKMRAAVECLGVAGAASVGWLVGREGERRGRRLTEEKWQRVPGFPLAGSVSAATAIMPGKQETGLVVREQQELVPEPGPAAGRVGQIMRFGFPGLDNIRSHSDYVLSYDRRNRVPHWVFEHLTRYFTFSPSHINTNEQGVSAENGRCRSRREQI